MTRHPSALALVAGAIAAAITPPSQLLPSEWGARNLVVTEGPRAGEFWDPGQTPYIPPIIDLVATSSPVTKITVRKSAQVGYTAALLVWFGYIACEAPGRAMSVMPTVGTAEAFNRDKLQPSIEASKALRSRVYPLGRRGASASTALYKGFPGGSAILTGANSAADLQSKTIKFALGDEIDQWPRDLEGQGSPMGMLDARQKSFHATGDYKKLQGGTPTNKGSSLVDDEFDAGDQRFWTMTCPRCGHDGLRFTFKGLRYEPKPPHKAWYEAECCGGQIEHWEKAATVRGGRFVADVPGEGRHPSFHIDALISLFTTWDHIVAEFVAAGDDPLKLKNFSNFTLGEAYEDKGDAPDWKVLLERSRKETYSERAIPPDVLLTTGHADVQKRGIFVELVGWTPDRRSYTLYAAYLPAERNDTSDLDDRCWRDLTEIAEGRLPDAFGNLRPLDGFAIDCRFNAPVVYEWCRKQDGAFPLRTQEGWGLPVVGQPVPVDYDWRGRRVKNGPLRWSVGSYNLKRRFYAHLRREITVTDDGEVITPAAYCHFGPFLDQNYFKQLCSEFIGVDKAGNQVWLQRDEQNHFLDCRVLGMALAYGILGLDRREPEQWAEIARGYGVPEREIAAFRGELVGEPTASEPSRETRPEPPHREARPAAVAEPSGWLRPSTKPWI